jgi:hypothetical protein
MPHRHRLGLALLIAALVASAPAFAEDAASATPFVAGDETSDQIAAYLRDLPPAEEAYSDPYASYVPYEERRTRREVGVAIGNHGYRSVYGRQVSPLGQDGILDIAVQHSRFNGRFGPRSGTALSVSLDFSGRSHESACEDVPPWRRTGIPVACVRERQDGRR